MMDIRFTLDINSGLCSMENYCRIAVLPCYFLRDLVLVYIRFMSDRRSVDLSFTFISLHVGPVCVKMFEQFEL